MRTCWRSPAEILEAAASSYHEDRWELQDVRVVVVLEKSALAGIVEPVCKDLDTPLPRNSVAGKDIACGSRGDGAQRLRLCDGGQHHRNGVVPAHVTLLSHAW